MPDTEALPKVIQINLSYKEFAVHVTLYMLALSFRQTDVLGMTQADLVLDTLDSESYTSCVNKSKDVMQFMLKNGIDPKTGEPKNG